MVDCRIPQVSKLVIWRVAWLVRRCGLGNSVAGINCQAYLLWFFLNSVVITRVWALKRVIIHDHGKWDDPWREVYGPAMSCQSINSWWVSCHNSGGVYFFDCTHRDILFFSWLWCKNAWMSVMHGLHKFFPLPRTKRRRKNWNSWTSYKGV